MIRVISIRKAAVAGTAGALAWEALARPLLMAGVPGADIVRALGALAAPADNPWLWWPAGLSMHLAVGILWTVFYAYVFWALFAWRPVLQGLVFALIPALLAETIVYPQLLLMHAVAGVAPLDAVELMAKVGWPERASLLGGHLIFGAVMGALYTRPVGYRAGRRPKPAAPAPYRRPQSAPKEAPSQSFIFASGVEGSYPTLEGGRWRVDQMEACGHYRRWRQDFELAKALGLTHLRWGPPLHLTLLGPDRHDWSFADQALQAMQEIGLTPILDLCHFGLPDWLGDFQNPEACKALAAYAKAAVRRYPQVRFWTPVNEMYVCARLSALDGQWNEQRRDDTAFVTAARTLARANVLMMQAILKGRPDAVFINSESGEFYQACCPDPDIVRMAEFENQRRFLPLDLTYAHPVREDVRSFLFDHGMPRDEYAWFMDQKVPRRAVLGVDYYEWNEKLIDANGQAQALGELFGWFVIARQYHDRYRRPMMHTETNRMDAVDAPHWLWRQWHNVQLIRKAGVPVIGFTWYSLTDQVDWDTALGEALGVVNPVGLFDLNRDPRAVALAYRHLIRTFRDAPELRDCPDVREVLQ